ncbi:type III polyketide synthase [Saccharomonospora saliphila]|uniref:type III polyketide synthase n=1 Tax=Saccharomonospora saliphila TaxID=369829 RepID=UPI00037EEF10|nr:3-oxoacyl-[acyl-carrier-protein] synthase III C-terminal domain-containing protein [Saccharomonospora saliphila]
MVTAAITGVGTALPETIDQRALWDGFFRGHFASDRLARRIFEGSGVDRRHAVANPLTEDLSHSSTAARMRRYAERAPDLGHRAVAAALADAGLTAEDLGQLTVVSCTGYTTPGLDITLAASLKLPPRAHRLLVGHMGCYAALPALGNAAAFAITHERPVALLCLELTSLHVQPPTTEPQQVVSHALFSDAAAALVLQCRTAGSESTSARGVDVVDTAAFTDTSAAEHMTWDVTDLGFRMGLSPHVPDVLAEHLPTVIGELLARNGLGVPDVRGWAVHPGGPRILHTVERTLRLPADALAASRTVLAEHDNCSSGTVLLVLDELRANGALDDGGPVVALAFGPGLTLYAALLMRR